MDAQKDARRAKPILWGLVAATVACCVACYDGQRSPAPPKPPPLCVNATGSNAILADPLLSADYHPRSGSPALDAGLTIPWLTADLAGNSRPQESGYDLGAHEGAVLWKVYRPLVLRNR